MALRGEVETGRAAFARAQKRFPSLVIDRDALARFLERAALLIPAGDVALAIVARDGAQGGTFSSLRDLAADAYLSARLNDVEISFVRTEAGVTTHELRLHEADGQATLLALGEALWAFGSLGILAELLTIYAKPQPAAALPGTLTLNYFSAGFALAFALAAGAYRGLPCAVAAAAISGAVWFLFDLALAEIRLLLTPPKPAALTFEIRTERRPGRSSEAAARLWLVLRLLVFPGWLAVFYLTLALVFPHLPKHW